MPATNVKPKAKHPHSAKIERVWGAFLLSLGLLGLLVSNYTLLWNRFILKDDAANWVAEVIPREGAVRSRGAHSLVWKDLLTTSQKVGDGDAVFTADESQAEILIGGESVATVAPNSLVIVRAPKNRQEQPEFIIKKGNLTLANGFKARLSRIEDDSEPDEIGLKNPHFIAPTAEPKEAPRPPVAPAVSQKAAPPKKEIQILPSLFADRAEGSTRLRKDWDFSFVPLMLRWKTNSPVESYDVTVFSNNAKVFERTGIANSQLAVSLKNLLTKPYFYQVRANLAGGQKILSQIAPLQLTLANPAPRYPAAGSRLAKVDRIVMTWEKTLFTNGYELQISKEPSFANLTGTLKTAHNFCEFKNLKPGTYFWRLRAVTRQGESAWSAPSNFTIPN